MREVRSGTGSGTGRRERPRSSARSSARDRGEGGGTGRGSGADPLQTRPPPRGGGGGRAPPRSVLSRAVPQPCHSRTEPCRAQHQRTEPNRTASRPWRLPVPRVSRSKHGAAAERCAPARPAGKKPPRGTRSTCTDPARILPALLGIAPSPVPALPPSPRTPGAQQAEPNKRSRPTKRCFQNRAAPRCPPPVRCRWGCRRSLLHTWRASRSAERQTRLVVRRFRVRGENASCLNISLRNGKDPPHRHLRPALPSSGPSDPRHPELRGDRRPTAARRRGREFPTLRTKALTKQRRPQMSLLHIYGSSWPALI